MINYTCKLLPNFSSLMPEFQSTIKLALLCQKSVSSCKAFLYWYPFFFWTRNSRLRQWLLVSRLSAICKCSSVFWIAFTLEGHAKLLTTLRIKQVEKVPRKGIFGHASGAVNIIPSCSPLSIFAYWRMDRETESNITFWLMLNVLTMAPY